MGLRDERTGTCTWSSGHRNFRGEALRVPGVLPPSAPSLAESLAGALTSQRKTRSQTSPVWPDAGGPEERAGAATNHLAAEPSRGEWNSHLQLRAERSRRAGPGLFWQRHTALRPRMKEAILRSNLNKHSVWPEKDTVGTSSDRRRV